MKRLLVLLSVLMTIVLACHSSIAEGWICSFCGHEAKGQYCSLCGERKTVEYWECASCGSEATGNYCNNCGTARNAEVTVNEEPTTDAVSETVEQNTQETVDTTSSVELLDAEAATIDKELLDLFHIEFNESKFTGQRLKISYFIKLKEYTDDSPDVIDVVAVFNAYKDESKSVVLASQEKKISLYKSFKYDAKGNLWIALPEKYDSGVYWEGKVVSISGIPE